MNYFHAMQKRFTLLFLLILPLAVIAQDIDVQHYKFELELSDKSDTIKGKATITVKALESLTSFNLHLVRVAKGKGMLVERVIQNSQNKNRLRFVHTGEQLTVILYDSLRKGHTTDVTVFYKGIPADGLVISKNKFGERTFFGDNWPTRARNWLPSNDVPADKSSVEFIVTAPGHYSVVSNGIKLQERELPGKLKLTHWKEDLPLPTKVMVIGVARFAIKNYEGTDSLPVSAWVYPKDSSKGFHDYALAMEIIDFFRDYIGPYPYRKLANVQSTTIFGGMENANAIFYDQNSVRGDRSSEGLIAHEIAHQWFGNMATEKHFSHLWLSEGFATYLTNLYMEKKYGEDARDSLLKNQKRQVLRFAADNPDIPVVDSTSPYMDLLNANSYQKGAWILHMLREEVGDLNFREIIRTYYNQYQGSNADSRDFQRIAESIAGRDLNWFFDQWLNNGGVPKLEIQTSMRGGINEDELLIDVMQHGSIYKLPLNFTVIASDGEVKFHRVYLDQKEQRFTFKTKAPAQVTDDQSKWLLYIEKK